MAVTLFNRPIHFSKYYYLSWPIYLFVCCALIFTNLHLYLARVKENMLWFELQVQCNLLVS